MSSGLRELRVWQEAIGLAGDVVRALRSSVRRETKAVSDNIMLTALAIGSHIADGFARPAASEQKESYLAANFDSVEGGGLFGALKCAVNLSRKWVIGGNR